MAGIDIFQDDAFSTFSLTTAVEKTDYIPSYLGNLTVNGMPLFEPEPVRTETVAVEQLDNTLSIIQTSERGTPPTQKAKDKRTLRDFRTVRLAPADRIHARELQNIRAFGSETELQQVQQEVARRQRRLRQDLEATWENLRFGAVQGIVTDADDSTIYDYFSEFGISQDAEIDFELDDAGTDVQGKCAQVVRQTEVALGNLSVPGMKVYGLCSNSFYDSFKDHAKVRDTFTGWSQATALRESTAFREFEFGGINFINYRGTDDGTSIALEADKVKFFPAGAPGVFQMAMSPGESFEWVNTLGRELYSMIVPDRDRNMYADIELYSYVLPICTRPKALQRGKKQ